MNVRLVYDDDFGMDLYSTLGQAMTPFSWVWGSNALNRLFDAQDVDFKIPLDNLAADDLCSTSDAILHHTHPLLTWEDSKFIEDDTVFDRLSVTPWNQLPDVEEALLWLQVGVGHVSSACRENPTRRVSVRQARRRDNRNFRRHVSTSMLVPAGGRTHSNHRPHDDVPHHTSQIYTTLAGHRRSSNMRDTLHSHFLKGTPFTGISTSSSQPSVRHVSGHTLSPNTMLKPTKPTTTETRFTRTCLRLRRNHFSLNDSTFHTSRQRSTMGLPRLVVDGKVTTHNQRFAVIDLDVRHRDYLNPLGAVGTCVGFTDICLPQSLRKLGFDVPIVSNGPFRALTHGNEFLRPFDASLSLEQASSLSPGPYVVWSAVRTDSVGHFSAALIDEAGAVTVMDGDRKTTHRNVCDLGRVDQFRWYRVTRHVSQDSSDPPTSTTYSLESTSDNLARKRSAALFLRQRRMEERKRQRLSDSAMSETQRTAIDTARAAALGRRRNMLHRPCPPLGWPTVSIPPTPTFDTELLLPQVCFLSRLNEHARDRRIVFYEPTHTYLLDGRPSMGSATGLIHRYSQPFDEDVIIPRMMNGNSWPRPAYLRNFDAMALIESLSGHDNAEKLISALEANPMSPEDVCEQACSLLRVNPAVAGAPCAIDCYNRIF